jgi:hypothetical protein
VEATCATWPNVARDLGGSGTAGDRCCPLRSGHLWPGCGPNVAPTVTSLEGASWHSAQPGCSPDRAAQRVSQPTAVVRGGPSGTDATGTRRARPAGTNLARALRRWSPARPEGEARPGWPPASLARAGRPAAARDADCSLAWFLPAGYNGYKWMPGWLSAKACTSMPPHPVGEAKGAVAWPATGRGSRCEALL